MEGDATSTHPVVHDLNRGQPFDQRPSSPFCHRCPLSIGWRTGKCVDGGDGYPVNAPNLCTAKRHDCTQKDLTSFALQLLVNDDMLRNILGGCLGPLGRRSETPRY